MKRDWWIHAVLLLAIAAVFSQVHNFDFVNYDDPDYVTANPHVRDRDPAWAFTSTDHANWFPLTRLSHILDVELFGMESGAHHLTNVAIHAVTSLLLLALLLRTTGERWPSAFVAFIFALHPLHVESVVWIAERKDVLCGLFFILALWAYALYVERPGPLRYTIILIAFLCGIMAKQMIVTFPFVALLFDLWPLRRFSLTDLPPKAASRSAILEKLPFFALSAAAALLAYIVQQRGGSVSSLDQSPLGLRLENAAVSCVTYILQFFWPARLAVFYPFPAQIPAWQWIAATVALVGITAAALRRAETTVGWVWYLGMLIPVIGFVKIGLQARADRYTYLPLIGLSIAIAWGAKALVNRHKWLTVPIAIWACALLPVTYIQASSWRNSIALFDHAIAVTDGNYIAQNNLGAALREANRRPESMSHFEQALALRPNYPEAQNNLGEALLVTGQPGLALPHIQEALRLDPDLAEAHINLAAIRNRQGRPDLAEPEYRAALQLNPASAEANDGLAGVLLENNRPDEALPYALQAVALNPADADSHYNLGRLYALTGRTADAVAQFREAVRLQPDNAEAHFNLGVAAAQNEQLAEAVSEFSAAIRAKPAYASAHFNLGSAYARLNQFDQAIPEFAEALRLDPTLPGAREALDYCKSLRAGK
jgi:tetratricopeptide (TPR) repeat protein